VGTETDRAAADRAAGWMREAIRLSREGCAAGEGGPFGAVVVETAGGRIVGRGCNRVLATNDPTAHAEIVAIRDASRALSRHHLAGCDLVTSCEPCPMCLAAAYWARVDRIWYGNTREDAGRIGFQDDFLYEELAAPLERRKIPLVRILGEEALRAFDEFAKDPRRRLY
jgi:guanine deaminase